MTIINISSSADFLIHLVNPAARALMLASIAGLTLAAFRVKATSSRLFAWKTVLYAALAMPLLGSIVPAIQFQPPSMLLSAARQLPNGSDESRHSENQATSQHDTHRRLPLSRR